MEHLLLFACFPHSAGFKPSRRCNIFEHCIARVATNFTGEGWSTIAIRIDCFEIRRCFVCAVIYMV